MSALASWSLAWYWLF